MRAGALLSVLLLCACGWVEVGDPGQTGRRPQTQAAEPRKAVSEKGEDRIRVRKGDSVYLIARRHGVAMRDIIERNGLAAPYHLREGQTLVLPAPRQHVVQAGDSVWLLSRRYGVPFAALVRANGLKKPYTIYKGATLRIPRGAEPLPEDIVETRAEAAPERASAPAPKPRKRKAAAGTPPVPSPSPAAVAGSPRPARSDPVKSEAHPKSASAPKSGKTARSGDDTPAVRKAPASTPAPDSRPAAEAKPAPTTVAEPPRAPVQTALKPLPPRAGRFLRPMSGPVVAGFGPQPDGLHNDGINIAAPRGAPVHAAEAGRVAYSGNELPGYGNLLLIRHRGGWVSAYAHNDRLLVGRGDEVQRGQRIALVGSSGRVTTPQLHFELRKQGRAVDPAPHLGGG